MTRLLSGLLAASALALWPAAARASDPVHLAYEAPAECPGEGEFTRAVRSRGASWSDAAAGETARRLEVSVRPLDEGGFVGSLRIKAGDDASVREVRGARCGEVVDALAAVTAITLREGSAAPAPAKPPSPAVTEPPADSPAKARRPEELRLGNDIHVTLLAGLVTGSLPAPLTRVDLAMERLNLVRSSRGVDSVLTPVMRLRVSAATGSYRRAGLAVIDLTELSIGFGPCMALRYQTTGLGLMACSELAMRSQSIRVRDDLPGAQNLGNDILHASLGANLQARYAIGSWLHVALALGGDALFGEQYIRTQLGQNPRIPVGEVLFFQRNVSFFGQLGAGVHF